MQGQNGQLQNKLNDLTLISNIVKIDKNFILGYMIRAGEVGVQNRLKDTIKVAELAEEAIECELISRKQFLSLIVVLGYISARNHFGDMFNLMEFYQQLIETIIYHPDYLEKQYFSNQNNNSRNNSNSNSNISNINISSKVIPSSSNIKPFSNIHSKIQLIQSIIVPPKLLPQKQMEIEIKEQQSTSEIKRNKSNIAECPVCQIQIKHHNICILSCSHIIHQQCFQECMKVSIMNKKFPLKCPFQECSKHIQTADIQQYLPKELIEKYYQFTLQNFVEKNNKNMSWCPTSGCSNAFQFGEGISGFKCMKCGKSYCLVCKTQTHYGKTCKENMEGRNVAEEDKEFIEFAKGARYKQCPECKFWVQKSKGCCHMTCRCEYQFCYVCGVTYGDCNCQQTYEHYYGSDNDDQQQSQLSQIERNEQYDSNQYNQQEDYEADQPDEIAQQSQYKQSRI